MIDSIKNHRSIRKFLPGKLIEDKDLENILSAGVRASNTGNMQSYSIISTTDKDLRHQLWEVHFKQEMVLNAPVHLTFCVDFNRITKWCLQRKANPGFDNFISFLHGAIDALLVSENIALAAESKGIGVCYLGTAAYNADKLIELLDLPKLTIPVTSMVIGYPEVFPDASDRLPLDGVVHKEKYRDYSKSEIDRIYKEKEALDFTLELLKINNKETLAQIFTDIRYKNEDNQFFSRKYLQVLKDQGFLNMY